LKETYQNTPVSEILEAVTEDETVVEQINDFIKSAENLEIELTDAQIETVYQKMMTVKSTATQKIITILGTRLNILGGLFA
jgi:TusA-related sulfurtransferase